MSCCGEYGCRRAQPVRLYLGDLTGQVFAATRSTPRLDAHRNPVPGSWAAQEKHDVTAAMREFIRRNPQWVRRVLEQP